MRGYKTSSPKNVFQKTTQQNTVDSQSPPDELDRIGYGVISTVDYDTNQVKVKRLLTDGEAGEEISDSFIPLSTSLSEIHFLWGSLREGLVVRYYWKGKLRPKGIIVEIIGDEDHAFLRKDPILNEMPLGMWEMFQGGYKAL